MTLSSLIQGALPYLQWLTLLSIGTFLFSILLIPWCIGKLPREYFSRIQKKPLRSRFEQNHYAIFVLRNALGSMLVGIGILLLFLPGQGLITILLGLLCMSFPGKHRLLLYLLSKPTIQKSLDWTRRKMHKQPFHWEK